MSIIVYLNAFWIFFDHQYSKTLIGQDKTIKWYIVFVKGAKYSETNMYTKSNNFLGVTVLLSLTVFQDSVSATMPITSLQIPLLGKLRWTGKHFSEGNEQPFVQGAFRLNYYTIDCMSKLRQNGISELYYLSLYIIH